MAQLAKPVGRTTVALDARSAENRTRETNVGNFVTDAFRKATAADVGFMNGGSVRADGIIGPGKLTQRDFALDPSLQKQTDQDRSNRCDVASRARTWRESQRGGFGAGRFPAGFRRSVFFRRESPTRGEAGRCEGKWFAARRREKIHANDDDISLALDGGDGYSMFKGSPVIIPPERAPIDVDAVGKHSAHGRLLRRFKDASNAWT